MFVFISFVFVSAASSIETEFIISGCNFPFEGETVSVGVGQCSSGEAAGYFYCGEDKIGLETTEEGLGCAMGAEDFSPGDSYCCPSGSFCNETSSGEFECSRRFDNCVNQDDEGYCNAIGCLWIDEIDTCVDGMRDYACGYYNTSEDCSEDKYKLGVIGVGTELCSGEPVECAGFTIQVDPSSCRCEWHPEFPGQECQTELTASQKFGTTFGTLDAFSCTNSYSLGECTDGDQDVVWLSSSSDGSGVFSGSIPEECLTAVGCNGGESSRRCGEELIKVPGFSSFSFILALSIIFLFYFSKRE